MRYGRKVDPARVKRMVDRALALLSDPVIVAELIEERQAAHDRIQRQYRDSRRFTSAKSRRHLNTPCNAARRFR